MSASGILASLSSQVSSTLGSGWQELKYVYDPENNDLKTQKQGFGVGIGGSDTVSGTNKSVTYDQEFFVILTDSFGNRRNDESQRDAISTLLTAKESLDVQIFQKKLNNSDVLLVQEIGMDEPEIIATGVVLLRFRYIIKFRNNNF